MLQRSFQLFIFSYKFVLIPPYIDINYNTGGFSYVDIIDHTGFVFPDQFSSLRTLDSSRSHEQNPPPAPEAFYHHRVSD